MEHGEKPHAVILPSGIKYVYLDNGTRNTLTDRAWLSRIRDKAHTSLFGSQQAPMWDTYQLKEEEVPRNGRLQKLTEEINYSETAAIKTKMSQDKVYG